MKKLLMVLAMFVLSIGVSACGGGGGSSATATPVGTVVNLTAFKGVMMGTATGTQFNYPNLSGSDSQNRAWTGSYSLVADGATTFEAQNVTKSRASATLKLGAGTPVTGITTYYYQVADGSVYKATSSFGYTSTPASQTALPSLPKVGDFGIIGTFNNTDGTSSTITWSLVADVNGASQLVFSYVVKTGATVTATTTETHFLDANGNPTRFSVSTTTSGVTVNLSGARS